MGRTTRSKPRRRSYRWSKPTEYAANGAIIAQTGGVCYWCGERYLGGHPIRFYRSNGFHDGPCYDAARLTNDTN